MPEGRKAAPCERCERHGHTIEDCGVTLVIPNPPVGRETTPSIHECLAVLDEHLNARLDLLPKPTKKRRYEYDYLCPECRGVLRTPHPIITNRPAVDTRDGSIRHQGPLILTWSCGKGCQSKEAS